MFSLRLRYRHHAENRRTWRPRGIARPGPRCRDNLGELKMFGRRHVRIGSPAVCRRGTLFGGILLAVTVALGGAATPSEAAGLPGSFHGNAYGTAANAKAGPVAASLGRNAFLPCPCRGTNGQTLTNTIDHLAAGDNGDVLTADELRSTVLTETTATTARVQDTATVSGLNMFGGLITATAIKAVATVSADATTITGAPDGSGFVGLKIN